MNIKILDFTTRLPGPLAGALLADLGAQVTKVELEGNEDPFLGADYEPAFKVWCQNFQSGKSFERVNSKDDERLSELLKDCDLALCPPSGFSKNLMSKYPDTMFIEVIGGSGEQKYLHDLNALFLTKSFSIHLEGQDDPYPPYLPLAGIIFAQQIALEALAGYHQKMKDPSAPNRKIYLDKCAIKVLDKLWSEELENRSQKRFLHNGRYPCYNIYKSKDGQFVGLAAVETRFWMEFSDVFNLELNPEDRFDESGKTGQKLTEMFCNYSALEIGEIIGKRDICVNVFPK